MRPIIIGAGRGSRLGPRTDEVPKTLIPVMERPMLDWILDALAAGGFSHRDVVFIADYRAEVLRPPAPWRSAATPTGGAATATAHSTPRATARSSSPKSRPTATQDANTAFVLDDMRRRELDAKAQSLINAQVVRAPSYFDAQLLHASVIQARATRDLPMLTKVPVDGSLVTAHEVREAGHTIAYASEVNAAYSTASSAARAKRGVKVASAEDAPSPETLSVAALRAEIKHHRGVILGAFDLRFRGDPEGRKVLQRVRAHDRDAKLVAGNALLLGLCQSPKHQGWIESLPRGESRSVERLAAIAPVFARKRAEPNTSRIDLRALKARRDRAWTLVHRACERLRAAGLYLTRDDPDRKNDYRAYKRPVRKKKTA